MQENERLRAHLRQLTFLCLGFPFGVAAMAGVVWFLLGSGTFRPPLADSVPYLGNLLNLVALSTLIIAVYVPSLMKAPGRDASPEDVLSWHRGSTIVSFAMKEAAGIMALVGALLTGKVLWAYPVVGLAIVAMVATWPRAGQLEGVHRR